MNLNFWKKKEKRPLFSNNSWFHIGDPETTFVFIHGLLSSADECWRNANGKFWPEIVATDPEFSSPSVYLAGFHTAINANRYDIAQCVGEIFRAIRRQSDGKPAPIASKNLIFVCHSLGGVVTRRLLEEHQRIFQSKNVAIVLVASPTLGSTYATRFRKVASAYGFKVVEQLLPNSDALTDIDNRFRRLIATNEFESLCGVEFVEHHGPIQYKWLPQLSAPVVDANSASRYFGPTTLIPGTDHFSIAKPDGQDHESHRILRDFYTENIRPLRKFSQPVDTYSIELSSATPLFDIYQPVHSEFYVNRTQDDVLARALLNSSAWLSGPSGVGKTSLAKRWVDVNGFKPIEITLSRLAGGASKEDLILEIRESLDQYGVKSESTNYNGTVDAIAEQAKRSVVSIFLDEVPLRSEDQQNIFTTGIGDLLDAVKRRSALDVRFLVCSIHAPSLDLMNGKMREQFEIVSLNNWNQKDIEELFSLIERELVLPVPSQIRALVIATADGSPRFIKMFFRKVQLTMNGETPDFQRSLELTKESMREI